MFLIMPVIRIDLEIYEYTSNPEMRHWTYQVRKLSNLMSGCFSTLPLPGKLYHSLLVDETDFHIIEL